MHSSLKSTILTTGLLIASCAIIFAQDDDSDLVGLEHRQSDSGPEAYDNIYTALSDTGNNQKRPKRQGRAKSAGKKLKRNDGPLPPELDLIHHVDPDVVHTASVGYILPLENGFVPSERYPRATTSTPRFFDELVEIINPGFNQPRPNPQQTNFHFANTNPNPPNPNPNQFSNPGPNNQFSSTQNPSAVSFNTNNNNNNFNGNTASNSFRTTTRPSFSNPGVASQATGSPSPVPNTNNVENNFIKDLLSQQKFGRLKTGNGLEVEQTSAPPKKSGKKGKKKQGSGDRDRIGKGQQLTLQDVELIDENVRQPTLTFVSPDLLTSSSLTSPSKILGQQVKVPGFPNGLPAQVPEGVRIALASAQRGPDGEFIMNPIPGQAGVDFPVLAVVPETGFNCNTQKFPGIYADQDADCQVFHMCQPNGNSDSFLCPNGTVFNQQYFICDWWYNVDCSASSSFYPLNEFIYQDQDDDNRL